MEARPVKAGKARLDLLKLAAAKLNDYLLETSNVSQADAPEDELDDVTDGSTDTPGADG